MFCTFRWHIEKHVKGSAVRAVEKTIAQRDGIQKLDERNSDTAGHKTADYNGLGELVPTCQGLDSIAAVIWMLEILRIQD